MTAQEDPTILKALLSQDVADLERDTKRFLSETNMDATANVEKPVIYRHEPRTQIDLPVVKKRSASEADEDEVVEPNSDGDHSAIFSYEGITEIELSENSQDVRRRPAATQCLVRLARDHLRAMLTVHLALRDVVVGKFGKESTDVAHRQVSNARLYVCALKQVAQFRDRVLRRSAQTHLGLRRGPNRLRSPDQCQCGQPPCLAPLPGGAHL
jgi:hypothetical protein